MLTREEYEEFQNSYQGKYRLYFSCLNSYDEYCRREKFGNGSHFWGTCILFCGNKQSSVSYVLPIGDNEPGWYAQPENDTARRISERQVNAKIRKVILKMLED